MIIQDVLEAELEEEEGVGGGVGGVGGISRRSREIEGGNVE